MRQCNARIKPINATPTLQIEVEGLVSGGVERDGHSVQAEVQMARRHRAASPQAPPKWWTHRPQKTASP